MSATWPTGDIELATLERRDIGSIDLDRFVTDCREANAENEAHKAMQEVVTRAVPDSRALMQGVGEPQRAGVQKLYHGDELTVLNVIWEPHMTLMPHNHEM